MIARDFDNTATTGTAGSTWTEWIVYPRPEAWTKSTVLKPMRPRRYPRTPIDRLKW